MIGFVHWCGDGTGNPTFYKRDFEWNPSVSMTLHKNSKMNSTQSLRFYPNFADLIICLIKEAFIFQAGSKSHNKSYERHQQRDYH